MKFLRVIHQCSLCLYFFEIIIVNIVEAAYKKVRLIAWNVRYFYFHIKDSGLKLQVTALAESSQLFPQRNHRNLGN